MKKVTINILDPSSIKAAIDELNRYKKWVPETADKLLYKIALQAANIAQNTYNTADWEVPWRDNSTVSVNVSKIDDGYAITADGEEVCFIEFGTGVKVRAREDPVAEYAKSQGVLIYPGAWSVNYGKGTWTTWQNSGAGKTAYEYNGAAVPGMLAAYKEIVRVLPQLIRETFVYK